MQRFINIGGGQRKIMRYFIIVILFPSLILFYLAYRGILNDQALLEKRNRERASFLSTQLINQTNDYLTNIEKEFEVLAGSFVPSSNAISKDSAFVKFNEEHEVVCGTFFIDNTGSLEFLGTKLLYDDGDHFSHTYDEINSKENAILERGWVLEFQKEDLPGAKSYYTSILSILSDVRSKVKALNAVARINEKLGNVEKATETYRQILKELPEVQLGRSLSAGLTSKMKIAQIYADSYDTLQSTKMALSILDDLAVGRWPLEESVFHLVESKTRTWLESVKATPNVELRSIKDSSKVLQSRIQNWKNITEILLAIRDNPENLVLSANQVKLGGTDRSRIVSYGFPILSSLPMSDEHGSYGIIFDSQKINDQLITRKLDELLGLSGLSWAIVDDEGNTTSKEVIRSSDLLLSSASFPYYLPDWTLDVYGPTSASFSALLTEGQSIYLFTFLFIGIVFLFGLVFTLQAINHELSINQLKSKFIDTVSHEFKSPLTSIRQMTEMLSTDRVPSDSRRREYYKTMHFQAEKLTRLVENIMDFSSLEKGRKKFHFSYSDIKDLLHDTEHEFVELLLRKNITVRKKIQANLPLAFIDRDSIGQVFYNLIDNAIKYSDDSNFIDIALHTENQNLTFKVTDYGLGIPKKDSERIFERFYRSDNHTKKSIKGTGIGLSIVKEVVRAHQGSVHVESVQGEGSSFLVKLPLRRNQMTT